MNPFFTQAKWDTWGFLRRGRAGQTICPALKWKKGILDRKKVLSKSMKKTATTLLQSCWIFYVAFIFILIFFFHLVIFSSSSTAVSVLGGQEGTFHSLQPNLHFRHKENPGSLASSAHTHCRQHPAPPHEPSCFQSPAHPSPQTEGEAVKGMQSIELQSPESRLKL